MNNEIKEILDNTLEYLEGIDETRNTKILTTNETNILLDYITNLQQEKEKLEIALQNIQEDYDRRTEENERLKEELKYTIPDVQHNQIVTKLAKEKNDYKSRVEKAIEYIRSNEWAKDYEISNCRTHLLNILQNGDNDG